MPQDAAISIEGVKEGGEKLTTHGFRATMGSWCAEQSADKRVSDLIKAHEPKYLDAAYQRSDLLEERRVVLQRWANYVTGTVPEADPSQGEESG